MLIIGVVIFISLDVFAKSFSGEIVLKSKTKYLVNTKSLIASQLHASDEIIASQIERLSTKDYLSLQGSLQIEQGRSSILVESIDFVGLGALLGIWKGSDNICYHFKSYTSLELFAPDFNQKCTISGSKIKPRKLSYFINPTNSVWIMLITDETKNFAGELKIKSKSRVQIDLFDNDSDNILSKITLRR